VTDKNPSSFYNEKYAKGRMEETDPSSTRWEDNGIFYDTAVTASYVAKSCDAHRIADIGCGRGFVVNHLRSLGFEADGYEYGEAALKHSVCGAKFCDITGKLDVPDGRYDFLCCTGVLSHVPMPLVSNALSELRRIVRKGGAIFSSILVLWTPTQVHHKTFQPAPWWVTEFQRAGWAKRFELDPYLHSRGLNIKPEEWACVHEAV